MNIDEPWTKREVNVEPDETSGRTLWYGNGTWVVGGESALYELAVYTSPDPDAVGWLRAFEGSDLENGYSNTGMSYAGGRRWALSRGQQIYWTDDDWQSSHHISSPTFSGIVGATGYSQFTGDGTTWLALVSPYPSGDRVLCRATAMGDTWTAVTLPLEVVHGIACNGSLWIVAGETSGGDSAVAVSASITSPSWTTHTLVADSYATEVRWLAEPEEWVVLSLTPDGFYSTIATVHYAGKAAGSWAEAPTGPNDLAGWPIAAGAGYVVAHFREPGGQTYYKEAESVGDASAFTALPQTTFTKLNLYEGDRVHLDYGDGTFAVHLRPDLNVGTNQVPNVTSAFNGEEGVGWGLVLT